MHGGFRGKAADSASYELALAIEESECEGRPFSALSVDIQKCFDQIPRELVVLMVLVLGGPFEIVSAWYRIMSRMKVINILSDSVGLEYQRRMSIP